MDMVFHRNVMEFLKAFRFYLYTDGTADGLADEVRYRMYREMLDFTVAGEEWHEVRHEFDVRLMNLDRCLGFILEPARDYVGEDAVQQRDLLYLRAHPAQELVYRALALREDLIYYGDGDPFAAAFVALVREMRSAFAGFAADAAPDPNSAASEARHYFMEVIEFVNKCEHLVPVVKHRFWDETTLIRRTRERFAVLQQALLAALRGDSIEKREQDFGGGSNFFY